MHKKAISSETRVKPSRFIRLDPAPFEGNPGMVVITVGWSVTEYLLWPIPSDFDTAFRLEKMTDQDAVTYHVLLSEGGKHSCECIGFLRWGRCKHIDGLLALRARGWL